MNMQDLRVGNLMHEGVRTVSEAIPLRDAARFMHDLGVSSLVVEQVDPSDAFGILTRKDIVEALCSEMPGVGPLLVSDVMTKPAITVAPELAISHCLRLMRMAGIRRAPVVKDGRLVGILSNSDVFRWLVEHANDA
ncbi:MAG: CBS domain-containing protein [Candidatus Hydrogenedentes bacterium]|nr:CBS domain-containing protein [Candidatus Hydrogenedentota bacterium]